MGEGERHSYAAVDPAEAVRILTEASGLAPDEDHGPAIARLVGCEPPALRWAASIARSVGWGPLRKRLATWSSLPSLAGSALPWQGELDRILATLPAAASLVPTLAACDGPFAWDLVEVVAGASIENVCQLEEAGLLERSTRAGVVTFSAPWCVRAAIRLADAAAAEASALRWLEAWAERAEDLKSLSYGVNAAAAIAELASALVLAERAVLDPATQQVGLSLWLDASDAMFFGGTIDFASPAFERAVAIADGGAGPEPRVRARLVAGRAALERGAPERAGELLDESHRIADGAARDDLRSEALRGLGWVALASARLDDARSSFEHAHDLASAVDPRGQADATAGLGLLALLSGDPERARVLLAESLAIHVVTRDAPREVAVRGLMELLPKSFSDEDAGLVKQVEELRATGQRWREALVLARIGLAARARGDAEQEETRLREARAAALLARMPVANLVRALVDERGETRESDIVVGFEGRSLRLSTGEVHDLSRHGSVRRMLWALAIARHRRPGSAMSTLDLVEAAWPGEKMKHEAATLRVYTTIRRLRRLGLEDALVTRDDGYLFDPERAVAIEGG